MSIATELNRIENSVAYAKQAITEKGGTNSDNTINTLAGDILALSSQAKATLLTYIANCNVYNFSGDNLMRCVVLDNVDVNEREINITYNDFKSSNCAIVSSASTPPLITLGPQAGAMINSTIGHLRWYKADWSPCYSVPNLTPIYVNIYATHLKVSIIVPPFAKYCVLCPSLWDAFDLSLDYLNPANRIYSKLYPSGSNIDSFLPASIITTVNFSIELVEVPALATPVEIYNIIYPGSYSTYGHDTTLAKGSANYRFYNFLDSIKYYLFNGTFINVNPISYNSTVVPVGLNCNL